MIHRDYKDTCQGPWEKAMVWSNPASPSTQLRLNALVMCPAFIDLGFGRKCCMACLVFEATNSLKGDNYNIWWTVTGAPQTACIQGICGIPATICRCAGVLTRSTTLQVGKRGWQTMTHKNAVYFALICCKNLLRHFVVTVCCNIFCNSCLVAAHASGTLYIELTTKAIFGAKAANSKKKSQHHVHLAPTQIIHQQSSNSFHLDTIIMYFVTLLYCYNEGFTTIPLRITLLLLRRTCRPHRRHGWTGTIS